MENKHFTVDGILPRLNSRTLPNGIVLHHLDPGTESSIEVTVIWPNGTGDTTVAGAHGLIPALMRASAHTDADKVADIIDYNGARMGCFFSPHTWGLKLKCLTDGLAQLLPIMVEVINEPLLDDREFELERAKGVSNLKSMEKHTTYIAAEKNTQRILGVDHPLARIVRHSRLEKITPADVLTTHREITASTPQVYISGHVSPHAIDTVAHHCAMIATSGTTVPSPVIHQQPDEPSRRDYSVTDARQSTVLMSIPTIERSHPHYHALRFAVKILGGNFGSRLMQEIRERQGLTYGINATLNGSPEGSHIEITSECAHENVDRLLEATARQIDRLKTEPLNSDELERQRLMAMTSLARIYDTSHSVTGAYITALKAHFDPDYYRAQARTLSTITAEQITHIAQLYLDAQPIITVAGK